MKRVVLFIVTNLAVVLVLSIVLRLLGLDTAMSAQTGMNTGSLLVFSAVVGFTGAIISLLMSKPMAKWSTGARVIDQPANEAEAWMVETVRRLSAKAGIGMPEVAVYEGAPNAFATGAFKNSALVAVSTGLGSLPKPASACRKSRSTRARPTHSRPAHSRIRRWSPCRRGSSSR